MQSFFSLRHGAGRTSYFRSPEDEIIEKLSGWQRKQWQRAGSPRGKSEIERFLRLQKDGTELYTGEIIPPRSATSR